MRVHMRPVCVYSLIARCSIPRALSAGVFKFLIFNWFSSLCHGTLRHHFIITKAGRTRSLCELLCSRRGMFLCPPLSLCACIRNECGWWAHEIVTWADFRCDTPHRIRKWRSLPFWNCGCRRGTNLMAFLLTPPILRSSLAESNYPGNYELFPCRAEKISTRHHYGALGKFFLPAPPVFKTSSNSKSWLLIQLIK